MVDSTKDLVRPQQFRGGLEDDGMALAGGMVIEFFHVPTGKIVNFKGMITDYTDSFATNYASTEVYGRMDPMLNFTNTVREINLGWALPAASVEEAELNLQKCALLISMLYPSYAEGGGATAIAAGPLFKLKFTNLVGSGKGGVMVAGLLGTLGGFEFVPDLDVGFFQKTGELLPKRIDCIVNYTVLHTQRMGWSTGDDPQWRGDERWIFGQDFPPGERREDSPGHVAKQQAAAAVAKILGGFSLTADLVDASELAGRGEDG